MTGEDHLSASDVEATIGFKPIGRSGLVLEFLDLGSSVCTRRLVSSRLVTLDWYWSSWIRAALSMCVLGGSICVLDLKVA